LSLSRCAELLAATNAIEWILIAASPLLEIVSGKNITAQFFY